MSMEQLAGVLSRLLEVPIVDKTGLTAYYDLLLKWSPDEASADTTSAPSIFTAIQETLGLRLMSWQATGRCASDRSCGKTHGELECQSNAKPAVSLISGR